MQVDHGFGLGRYWAHLLGALILAASSAHAQQRVLLEWVWQPGQQLTYEITEELDQESRSEAMGEVTEQQLSDQRVWTVEQTVLKVDEQGVATLQRQYTRLKMSHTDADGNKVSYDSDRPDSNSASDPRIKPFAEFVGHTIEFEVDRTGRVLRASGGGALIKAITQGMLGSQGGLPGGLGGGMGNGIGGGMGGAMGGEMDFDELFRRQIEQSLRILPGRSVRRGEKWDGGYDQPVPMLGSVRVNQTHTYKGIKRRGRESFAQIASDGKMELPDQEMLGGLISMKLDISEIAATSLVDVETGTLVDSDATMLTKVSGTSAVIEGMKFEQTLRQRAKLKLISGR